MERVVVKGKKGGPGKRKNPEEGWGSRKESYDVWTLANHPAKRSITPSLQSSLAGLETGGPLMLTPRPETRRGPQRDAQSGSYIQRIQTRHSLDRAHHPRPRLLSAPPSLVSGKKPRRAQQCVCTGGGGGEDQQGEGEEEALKKKKIYIYIYI
jgi:hypothetical protein